MGDVRATIAIMDRQVWLTCYQHHRRRWQQTALTGMEVEVPLCLQPADDLAPLTQRIIELVRQQTPSVVLVRLAIPGTWVYCHSLATAGANRKALAYDLEPHLPYALEDLAVAFTAGREPLGVAVLAAPLAGLLKALEAAGILVEHLGVDGIEAADPSEEIAIWLDEHHATIIGQIQGKPHQMEVLQYLPDQAETALLEWQRRYLWHAGQPDKPTKITLRGQMAAEIGHALSQAPGIDVQCDAETAEQAPLPLLQAQPPDRLNLRCGPLTFSGRFKPLKKILVQSLVLLSVLNLLLAPGWSLQARHNSQAVAQIQRSEQALWKQVFPERAAPPAGIGLYIASERVRLEALTGGGTDKKIAQRPDLLGLLRQVASTLPKEARILAQDLQVNAQQLVLRGQTRTHTEAEQINRAIGTVPPLQVQPASSDARPDGTVDFIVRATHANPDR